MRYSYNVYAGGFLVVDATLDITVNESDYRIFVDAKTDGWLGSMVPWLGSFETVGVRDGEDFRPTKHESIGIWSGEKAVKTYTYEGTDLVSLVIDEHDKPPETPEILPELVNNSTDILTATLMMLRTADEEYSCDFSDHIFDGKRRFLLSYQDVEPAILRESSYNIYSGPARFCTVEITPDGGKWHQKPRGWLNIQEQGRQLGDLPSIWVAQHNELHAIPARIQVRTSYGTLVMHLTNIEQMPHGEPHSAAAD